MSAMPKPLSVAAFLDWEEQQEWRYEFEGVVAEAMTGGTQAHARI